jgi:hypothetical protein
MNLIDTIRLLHKFCTFFLLKNKFIFSTKILGWVISSACPRYYSNRPACFLLCFMMTGVMCLLKESSLSIILMFLKIYRSLLPYTYMCLLFFSFCYVYFFHSFTFFHLIPVHLFLFSQGQINVDIDLNLFCSYYVLIYSLRNNISIAYFVMFDKIIVIYILLSSRVVLLFRIKWMKKKNIFDIVCSTSSI